MLLGRVRGVDLKREVVDHSESIMDSKDVGLIVWHTNCYSLFTDKGKIQRLKASLAYQARHDSKSTASESACPIPICKMPCSHQVKPVNWELCSFCQDSCSQERVSSVLTFKMSDQITEAAKYR